MSTMIMTGASLEEHSLGDLSEIESLEGEDDPAFLGDIVELTKDIDAYFEDSMWCRNKEDHLDTTSITQREEIQLSENSSSQSDLDEASINNKTESLARELSLFDSLVSTTTTTTKDSISFSNSISKVIVLSKFATISPATTPSNVSSHKSQVGQPLEESKAMEEDMDRSPLFQEGTDNLKLNKCEGGVEKIQFTGQVGTESRSIRTSRPLPRPEALSHKGTAGQRGGRLVRYSCINGGSDVLLKPLVSPFLNRNGQSCFIPRLVSYYEIKITESLVHPQDEPSSATKDKKGKKDYWEQECIAVGLASSAFKMKGSMPGWQRVSYGLHSDDGSVWGNGRRQGKGPSFGKGDTVGCGIDYRSGTIFYTKNGRMLAHTSVLSEDALLKVNWYPTIGLDAQTSCVECNFGFERRFVFDLLDYCKQPLNLPKVLASVNPPKVAKGTQKQKRKGVSARKKKNVVARLFASLRLRPGASGHRYLSNTR